MDATYQGDGSSCDTAECPPAAPTKWVLIDTRVNQSNSSADFVNTGRFEGTVLTFTETANSISVQDRDVDNGFENYNVTYTSNFPTPPSELIPGDTVTLDVSFTSSGTVTDPFVNYSWQFQYRVDGNDIDPPGAYRYLPFSTDFDGTSSTTYSFVVKGLGGELVISAFWFNCSECNVVWIYQPG